MKFSQAAGYLNKAARLTVQSGKGQMEVWHQVSAANEKSGAQTGSGTFTANYFEPEVVGELAPYVAVLEKVVADVPQVVGVIVAINGEIQAADTFESTPLFRKLWPRLLKSYVLDAATQATDVPIEDCALRHRAGRSVFARGDGSESREGQRSQRHGGDERRQRRAGQLFVARIAQRLAAFGRLGRPWRRDGRWHGGRNVRRWRAFRGVREVNVAA